VATSTCRAVDPHDGERDHIADLTQAMGIAPPSLLRAVADAAMRTWP
jgi:hypothetical protein